MFTGLIREIAKVVSLQNSELKIKSSYQDAKIGDSIAINGACLTVTNIEKDILTFKMSEESQKYLALENYKESVHLEPAMRLSDRVDGHLVQGHVDSIGIIKKINSHEIGTDLYIEVPKKVLRFMVEKGSITVDGVSLTINSVEENIVRLTIIPHTFENTIFRSYKIGTRVNIESDMITRSLYNLMKFEKENDTLLWQKISQIEAYY